jgi:hypothetical protein
MQWRLISIFTLEQKKGGRSLALCLLLLFCFFVGSKLMALEADLPVINIFTIVLDDERGAIWSSLNTDVKPYIHEGITMVPLRSIAEKFNYMVDYQDPDGRLQITGTNGSELVLFVNSSVVVKNGETGFLQQPPIVLNGRTFVPVRYISEFFGLTVSWWRSENNAVHLIWLSAVEFLTDDDVKPDENYIKRQGNGFTPPYGTAVYDLLDKGETARGVRIGDSVGNLVSVYGPAHSIEKMSDTLSIIYYYPQSDPREENFCFFEFHIENSKIVSITLMVYE